MSDVLERPRTAARRLYVLHCPFCGREPKVTIALEGGVRVQCETPTCQATPAVVGASEDHAVARWNSRKS
jgi:hypothetical protein